MNTSSKVSELLSKSKENIIEYFVNHDRDVFNDKLSNSLIERIIRKRKIKINVQGRNKKCQSQEEVELSHQLEADPETAEQPEQLQTLQNLQTDL